MKTTLAVLLFLAALRSTDAAESMLSAAERTRAQSIPHHATAGALLPDGSVAYGNLVLAAYDDGRVRVEFATDGPIQFELSVAGPEVANGRLRARFRAPEGSAARYANHGTLAVPGRGDSMAILRSDLRMDVDGLFALDLEGADPDGSLVPLQVFGRVIGTCWANDGGTLKRVADLKTRPDCLRLFGHL